MIHRLSRRDPMPRLRRRDRNETPTELRSSVSAFAFLGRVPGRVQVHLNLGVLRGPEHLRGVEFELRRLFLLPSPRLHLELVHPASIQGFANQVSPLSIRTQNKRGPPKTRSRIYHASKRGCAQHL